MRTGRLRGRLLEIPGRRRNPGRKRKYSIKLFVVAEESHRCYVPVPLTMVCYQCQFLVIRSGSGVHPSYSVGNLATCSRCSTVFLLFFASINVVLGIEVNFPLYNAGDYLRGK